MTYELNLDFLDVLDLTEMQLPLGDSFSDQGSCTTLALLLIDIAIQLEYFNICNKVGAEDLFAQKYISYSSLLNTNLKDVLAQT